MLETAELPLLRVLGPEVARVFAGLHREHGVDLRFGVQVSEITTAGGRASGVRLADGSHVQADAVVVGVGITPNTQLAEAAGLEVGNGVVVDAALRSSDPDIFAAGDVASAYHPVLGRHIRVEHWANALNQPQAAARAMLGQDVAYDRSPYFYTDQYDLGMEYSGYVEPGGYDQVVFRGDVERREFVAFWLGEGRVLAGMNVNVWDVNDAIQALVSAAARWTRPGWPTPACPWKRWPAEAQLRSRAGYRPRSLPPIRRLSRRISVSRASSTGSKTFIAACTAASGSPGTP